MGLLIHDSGAATAAIIRGVTPESCHDALQDFNIAEDPDVLPDATRALVVAWRTAENAAIGACCYGYVRIPEAAQLVWE